MENQNIIPLIKNLIPYFQANNLVLDLGAGQGKQAEVFLKHDMKVIAVDKTPQPTTAENLEWKQQDIREYVDLLTNQDQFDLIFAQNTIQFFTKDYVQTTLIPKLKNHLKPNGIIAIRTFYQQPEPPFDVNMSFFSEEDLINLFPDWEIIKAEQFAKDGPDLKGNTRLFHMTDIIVRKK